MKYLFLTLTLLLNAGCVMASEPQVKVTFHVTDAETSETLTNAMVKVFNDKWEIKPVDSNGFCSFKGQGLTLGWTGHATLDGYYKTSAGAKYIKLNSILNRMEPWNPTVEVRMRKIKNPVAMTHRSIQKNAFKVPGYNQQLGYDLERDAFVAPHGSGVNTDLYFNFKRQFENPRSYKVSCEITFPNKYDGIQECFFQRNQFNFQWPYLAPTNNYKPSLIWESIRSNAKPAVHNFDEKSVNYIFRIRTQIDEDGDIISAYYGKIEGAFGLGWADWVNWVYWFNPVANERSLEWIGEVPRDQRGRGAKEQKENDEEVPKKDESFASLASNLKPPTPTLPLPLGRGAEYWVRRADSMRFWRPRRGLF